MPGRAPEKCIKANLRREKAERLYELGREAVIWALLAFAAQLKRAQEKDMASDINTPSAQTPVYKKPKAKPCRQRKLGSKEGHPGSRHEAPETIDEKNEHSPEKFPCCGGPLGEPFEERARIAEDIPEVKPVVTRQVTHAEREIRPAGVLRTVIQQNRSDRAAHTQDVLVSVHHTLKLPDHDPVKTVVAVLSTYLETGTLSPLGEKAHPDR